MKKFQFTSILILLLFWTLGCQTSKYPELINKPIISIQELTKNNSTSKKYYDSFMVYQQSTTKNEDLPNQKSQSYPWKNKLSKSSIESIFNQIESSIKVFRPEYAVINKEPTNSILLSAAVSEEKGLKADIFNSIEINLLDYQLKNKKGDIITFKNDFFGTRLNFKGIGNKKIYYVSFENQNLQPKYMDLDGFIKIAINIPIDFKIVEVTKNDVGKTISINHQKIKVLELDGNAFHYHLVDHADENKFKTVIVGATSGVALPLALYEQFRNNQGLNYKSFVDKKELFDLDNIEKYNPDVWVYTTDNKIEKVYFYQPEYLQRIVTIPVKLN